MAHPETVLDAAVPRLRRSRPARFAPDVAWTEGAWLAAGAAVTDLLVRSVLALALVLAGAVLVLDGMMVVQAFTGWQP